MGKDEEIIASKNSSSSFQAGGFIEYHGCKQGDLSVEDFTNEFDRLNMRCDVDVEDKQTITRYFGALRPIIADVVQLQ